ncbi:DUF308 domain-containing protein [Klebsiella variicola]|uniref:DUF308 domain-containing protein n=1 Tax=Klebsiella variicola TaxID=244366 RepID=UPI0009BBC2F8|nr:DUF308 domain-containing protein [Klebsiella variicola]HCI6064461.1 DUF308 domain-containing protein [Klebsiella variicola subsp. variicola]EIY5102138.1 DUF308 domain-containing protein [Klebsiella variicola]EIY5154341.1 DUF308 domain-containing protein [Klebsiella variicola]EKW2092901.1 DUF308 domain-containing protein [Klebsiella variicola]EMD1678294.1 DUF308 domain-containing protein [Klebsiella variicola]
MSNNHYHEPQQHWLQHYYFIRTAFSILWVIAVFSADQFSLIGTSVLLILYPAWDAMANYMDALKSGGFGRSRMQTVNIIVSALTTLAVMANIHSMNEVIRIFGGWAILSGLLQLGAAVQRWKHYGAQWSMILSGAQSALAGAFFLVQSRLPAPPSVNTIAGYAAFGAIYYCLSAMSLTVRNKNELTL